MSNHTILDAATIPAEPGWTLFGPIINDDGVVIDLFELRLIAWYLQIIECEDTPGEMWQEVEPVANIIAPNYMPTHAMVQRAPDGRMYVCDQENLKGNNKEDVIAYFQYWQQRNAEEKEAAETKTGKKSRVVKMKDYPIQ